MTTLALYDKDPYLAECRAVVTEADGPAVCLDRTVFYPLGGGQAGDTGWLTFDGRDIPVTDTRRREDGAILHFVDWPPEVEAVGAEVSLRLDWQRRHCLMRLHTSLHVLGSLYKYPVTGAKVGPDKAHLDFDIGEDSFDKDAIALRLSEVLSLDLPVEVATVSEAEFRSRPELASENKAQPPVRDGMVRLVKIGSGNVVLDHQPCGGTHVRRLSEIGGLEVQKIRSRGRKNRRIILALK